MKKDEYLESISKKLGITKVLADDVINAYLEELKKSLINKDTVSITNFGVFTKSLVKPKAIFSPTDGSTYDTKEYYRITFKCSKKFIDELKK